MDENFPEGVSRDWRHGDCYAMAMALSEALGWPVATLSVTLAPCSRRHAGCTDHVVHAWVRAPDGRSFDAGGFFDDADLHGTFLDHPTRKFSDVRVEEFADVPAFRRHLDATFGGNEEWHAFAPHLERRRTVALAIAEERIVPTVAGVSPTP